MWNIAVMNLQASALKTAFIIFKKLSGMKSILRKGSDLKKIISDWFFIRKDTARLFE